jgi:adenylate cyclase
MTDGRVERRLAAVLAVDVAGYSRLMGADEVGTLAALKKHRREIFDPGIAAHNGRIVKTTGDGMLVEFASVVDAVTFAVEVQERMAERVASEAEPRILFRVGINVGDIIIDSDDFLARASMLRRVSRMNANRAGSTLLTMPIGKYAGRRRLPSTISVKDR